MKKENHSSASPLSPADLQLLEQIETWEPLKGELSGIVPVKQVALQYYPDYNPQSASRALRMSIRSYPPPQSCALARRLDQSQAQFHPAPDRRPRALPRHPIALL